MDVVAAISQIMGRHDNINPLDADQLNRRARILEYLQEVFNYLWLVRPWPFSMRTASVSVIDGVALLPDDFHDVTAKGGVWIEATGEPLDYVTPDVMRHLKLVHVGASANPDVYSIYDQDPAPPFSQLIHTSQALGTTSLSLAYQRSPAVLAEDSDSMLLEMIPAHYHQQLIIPGVRVLNEDSKGGSRGDKYEMWKIRALAEMQRGERKGGDRVRNVPTFFGGGYLS